MQTGKWMQILLLLAPAGAALPGAVMYFLIGLALAVWVGKQEVTAAIWPAAAGAIIFGLGFGLVFAVLIALTKLFISKSTRS